MSIWQLAAPMILSNLSIPLLGMVDMAVVGQSDKAYYLGAVGVAALIFDLLYAALGFLRMSTTGLVAQSYGKKDNSLVRTILGQALILAGIISIILLIFQTAVAKFAFLLVTATPLVAKYAWIYFSIRIWSAPATLGNIVLRGWFLGLHQPRVPLYQVLLISVIGISLDFFFVFGLGLGVKGVALATVIAQFSGLVFGLYLASRYLREHPGQWLKSDIFCWSRIRRFLKLNQDIFIRTLCLIFVFSFFTHEGAKQGAVILAVNTILLNFQHLLSFGLDGFANATEVLVGRAVGLKNRVAFDRAIKNAGLWSIAVAVIYSLIFAIFGQGITRLITDSEMVRLATYVFLPWMIVSPIVSVWSFLLDGIFIGATRSTEMRNTMLASVVLFFLPAWYFSQSLENHGLWLALMVFLAARAVTMLIPFRRILGTTQWT